MTETRLSTLSKEVLFHLLTPTLIITSAVGIFMLSGFTEYNSVIQMVRLALTSRHKLPNGCAKSKFQGDSEIPCS